MGFVVKMMLLSHRGKTPQDLPSSMCWLCIVMKKPDKRKSESNCCRSVLGKRLCQDTWQQQRFLSFVDVISIPRLDELLVQQMNQDHVSERQKSRWGNGNFFFLLGGKGCRMEVFLHSFLAFLWSFVSLLRVFIRQSVRCCSQKI